MNVFSMLSTIGGHWPFSYCYTLGHSAMAVLRVLKSTLSPYFHPSSVGTSAFVLATINQHRYSEHAGWIIQTRFHFGDHLSQYVGLSIFIKNGVCRLRFLARASGLLLLVGIGSYVAYRLCLRLLGCHSFTSLVHVLCNDGAKNQSKEHASQGTVRCRRCEIHKRRTSSHGAKIKWLGQRPCCCINCGERFENSNIGRTRDRHRFETDEYSDAHHSASDTTDDRSVDEIDDCEDNQTDETDVASDCSENLMKCQVNDHNENNEFSVNMERERRLWKNAARKRTNALDDGACYSNNLNSDEDSDTGFSKTRSPPPIRRLQTRVDGSGQMSQSMPVASTSNKAYSVNSMDVQSLPSSQQFIWDPLCSPDDESAQLNEELLSYFANVPTGELVQRFLDGLLLSSDQYRGVSPGPSEAASEFSLAADRQLGDGTAANFEQLQYDLSDLKTDMDELDVEFTNYLQERSGCLQSDSRLFYQSVIVDEGDDVAGASNLFERHGNSSPLSVSPSEENPGDRTIGAENVSPCHRLSIKRHRESHESSNDSSGSNDDGSKRTNSAFLKTRRDCATRDSEVVPNDEERHLSSSDHITFTSSSSIQKSALSVDTGYVSSYHTLLSSVDSKLFSPSSVPVMDDEQKDVLDCFNGLDKRPNELWLPQFSKDVSDGTIASVQRNSSAFLDVSPSSSYAHHTDCCSERSCDLSPSAISLEWEDEMTEPTDKRSPKVRHCHYNLNEKRRLKIVDLVEFLSHVDNLAMPIICEFGKKLSRRGYQHVLFHNDHSYSGDAESDISTPVGLGGLISASLICAVHYRLPIFKCQSFRIVPEAIDASMKRCSLFANACTTYFGSTTSDGTRECILQCMQKLWELHESVQQKELQSNMQREIELLSSWNLIDESMRELVDGMKMLMALRSLETYEEILFTRRTPCPFYTDLFRSYTPVAYAQQKLFRSGTMSSTPSTIIAVDDLDIALLADTLGVRIEVFRPHLPHPEFVAVYPELEHNAKINRARLPLLESQSGTGLFLPLL